MFSHCTDPRIRATGAEVKPGGEYVLYWARTSRRAEANHGLRAAVEAANALGLPVLFCEAAEEPLRFRRFLEEGAPETARRLRGRGIGYAFDADEAAVERRAARAAAVITDDIPGTRAPGFATAAVDSSCVVPMSLFPKQEYGAYTIRPKIRKLLPKYLKPFEDVAVKRRWRGAPEIDGGRTRDGSVPPSTAYRGGRAEAEARLETFVEHGLHRYARLKNEPSARATSGLSPYLHYGHLSALEVALAAERHAHEHGVMADEFLEELIVRRELAFNFMLRCPEPRSLDALPAWARETLARHAGDPRPAVYSREEFEAAATHDALWNATQNELRARGTIHGYYRMYWGKKVIEWSRTPAEALETMISLHDRWALDGRDPNTYANILWCFGLHDRPWPERAIFGTVRWMSLEGMRRKTDVDAYIREMEKAR